MSRNAFSSFPAALITHAILAAMLTGPMLLAAAGVAGLLFLAGAGPHWPWFAWVIIAPVLYLSWLILYMGICAFTTHQLGSRHPKPRHYVLQPGQSPSSPEGLGFRTAATCYELLLVIETLPLTRVTAILPGLGTLWLRAYSPALHLGRGVFLQFANIVDPDLTEIGDNTVLGGRSSLVAHAMAARPDGVAIYTSAPIKVGRRVTIGAQAFVGLGCVIGDDAILMPRAVLPPFTQIPAGEVWGGNPATFLRKRNAAELPRLEPETASAAPAREAAADISPATASGTPSLSAAALRELVVNALQLAPDEAPAELSSGTCAAWDSLGQIAIAAALFDRYGIAIRNEDVFRIRTLRDIEELVTRDTRESAQTGEPRDGMIGAQIASARDGASDASPVLPDDLEMLPLLEPREATRALAARFGNEPAGAQRLRVCIAASFTVQPVAPALRVWGRAFGFEIESCFADYDQIVQTLLGPDGLFAANLAGVNVILTRLEDLAADAGQEPTAQMDDLLDALRSFTSDSAPRGQLLVGTLPPVVSAYSPISERVAGSLRDRWRGALERFSGVEVFDFCGIVEHLGIERARNSQSEVLTRAPYSPQVYQGLGIALARSIHAARRAPAKVVAIDCDNTLWGGVVGEVGLDGIQLGPDGFGRSFQLFQRYLKGLKDRGILLVVASRNEDRDVREVFEKHPEMVLRADDIAAWCVNWEPKSKNIGKLAEELRLGVDSFVFLDDNPVEQMEVKSLVPGVHVVPLPSDPARYCEMLERLWLFDAPRTTGVDASRTRMIHEESRRQEESKSCRSLDEFLARLELRIEIGLPAEQEWPRIAQLTQRTNQFNLSLKRCTLEQLKSVAEDRLVTVLKAEDRFGDYGLVGTCILLPPDQSGTCEIDTFLMSCRALGRGVEDAFLHGVAEVAVRQGASKLFARYVEGPRNVQVKAFLVRHSFNEVQSNVFVLPLDELPPLPAHVRFHERTVPLSSFFHNTDAAALAEPR